MRLNENKFSVSRQTNGTLFRTDELSSNPVGRRRHAYVRIIGRLRGENGISEGLTRILLISFFFFSWAYLSSRRCLWCINSEILFRSSFTLRLSSSSSSPLYIPSPASPLLVCFNPRRNSMRARVTLRWQAHNEAHTENSRFFSYTDACHNALIRVAYRHGEGQYLYPRKAVYNIYTYTYNVSGFGADLTWHFICFCARNIPIPL